MLRTLREMRKVILQNETAIINEDSLYLFETFEIEICSGKPYHLTLSLSLSEKKFESL